MSPAGVDPQVAALLDDFLRELLVILGSDLTGLYLYGSLALGDFDSRKSDIDFLVACEREITAPELETLRGLHDRLAAGSRWGREIEGSYIPVAALRRYVRGQNRHPHIDRGGRLAVEQHDTDWVIQRFITREYGVTWYGPDPKTLIDPISPQALRQAVLDLLWWWELQLADTHRVEQSAYQAYAVLSMCRIRYTLTSGAVLSKPAAARWACEHLDARWTGLIERALDWQPGERLDCLAETLAFVRDTLETAKQV